MTRTSKTLGAALLALCAFGAVAASSASAVDTFTCTGQNKCDITGEGKSVFSIKSASVVQVYCTTETYSGTVSNNSSIITVTPTLAGCRGAVINNGCSLVLTGNTTSHSKTGVGTETDAAVSLECSHTGNITVGPILGCTITFSDTHAAGNTVNQNLHGVTYSNTGAGTTDDIDIKMTLDEIKYTAPGPNCAAIGLSATGSDGTFTTRTGVATPEVTAKGYLDPSAHGTSDHVGLFMDTA